MLKKLVEKASKKPGGNSEGRIKENEVDPHLVFHHGVPSGAHSFGYDPIQKILAVSTKDGWIKLFGKDNTQAVLESSDAVPSKFVEFIHNNGVLLNVTSKNHIEVWDIEQKSLSYVHAYEKDITSFTVLQQSLFIYVGDCFGSISILKLDLDSCQITQMKYTIPFSASCGNVTESGGDNAVVHILPQPNAESKRVLIVYKDGYISLWDLRESRSVFATGSSLLQTQYQETKTVTAACWACPVGSKLALGYNNGEILIWNIQVPNVKSELASDGGVTNVPQSKLNLGYKVDKIPIGSLKWLHADGKAGQLYVMGSSDVAVTNLLQVVLLNDQSETRTVKLTLPLSEPSNDMAIISSSCEEGKRKQDIFLVLGKSGHIYAYDDSLIEKYLLQSQSRGSPSLPKNIMAKLPFAESSITVAKLITENFSVPSSANVDFDQLAKTIPSVFPFETKPKDGAFINLFRFTGFTKVKNLYITGHDDGAVNFWDASYPFFIPVVSIHQQSEDDLSLSGVPVTALHFDGNSRVLISGDQNGVVRIFKFKSEPYAPETSFMPFQGNSRKGNNHIIQTVKLLRVNGSVQSISRSHSSGHAAIGTSKGEVLIVDIEGPTQIYQTHITTEISPAITSLQFDTCSLQGFEKNVLVVATKDSSVMAIDADTSDMMSTSSVHPKKPSEALFMQILNGAMYGEFNVSLNKGKGHTEQPLLLICSQKAVYVYSLAHVLQGVKKVIYKKKFHSSLCCWASTFCTNSDVGLVLLLSSGKIEIRSLPDLSLIKDSTVRGFTYSVPKPNSLPDSAICCSKDGELVMVKGDQEIIVVSVQVLKENFRFVDSFSQVYRKDMLLSQEAPLVGSPVQKEKKKGFFGYVIKDTKGSKTKPGPEVEIEDTKESIQELSTVFSTANFASEADNKGHVATVGDEAELDIDDIDLDDLGVTHKDQNKLPAKLTSTFNALKGKVIKQMQAKNEKTVKKEEQQQDERTGAVDQIKKKYGHSSSNETSTASLARGKLQDNLQKLQGISLRTTEMQDSAKSFSAMAKEALRTAEKR